MSPQHSAPDRIVLVHGFWVTPRSWEHWITHFENRGFTVIAPSYPGFEVEVEALNADPTVIADLTAPDVNAYLADLLGGDLTAKDFRTWHATVLAALSLAESEEKGDTVTSRRRAVKAAVAEVAEYLGNTPTVARTSYIYPRVIELYEQGVTITPSSRRKHTDPDQLRGAAERAVLRLLKSA